MADPYYGQIAFVGFTYAPYNWAFCDGSLVNVNQNPVMFAILGTMYGGDGRTTFGLPNLQGKALAGLNPNYGLIDSGTVIGSYNKPVGPTNLPAHTHAVMAAAAPGTVATASPVSNMPAQGYVNSGLAAQRNRNLYAGFSGSATPMNPASVTAAGTGTGASVAVNNRQPFLPINMIICMDGTFPPKPN